MYIILRVEILSNQEKKWNSKKWNSIKLIIKKKLNLTFILMAVARNIRKMIEILVTWTLNSECISILVIRLFKKKKEKTSL